MTSINQFSEKMSDKRCINIGGDVNDPFYRYKREKIIIKYQKQYTCILNLMNISKQLIGGPSKCSMINIVFESIIKKLKKKFNTSINVNDEQVNIRGNISLDSIENFLEEFIQKYILCPVCKLPEWNGSKCSACGHYKN